MCNEFGSPKRLVRVVSTNGQSRGGTCISTRGRAKPARSMSSVSAARASPSSVLPGSQNRGAMKSRRPKNFNIARTAGPASRVVFLPSLTD